MAPNSYNCPGSVPLCCTALFLWRSWPSHCVKTPPFRAQRLQVRSGGLPHGLSQVLHKAGWFAPIEMTVTLKSPSSQSSSIAFRTYHLISLRSPTVFRADHHDIRLGPQHSPQLLSREPSFHLHRNNQKRDPLRTVHVLQGRPLHSIISS